MTQKYRKGDIVTVQAVVLRQFGPDADSIANKVAIKVEDHYQEILLNPKQLTMIHPFFAAGERVITKSSMNSRTKIFGTVIAMHEGDVWVKFDHGKTGTVQAVDLEPLPDAPKLSAVA